MEVGSYPTHPFHEIAQHIEMDLFLQKLEDSVEPRHLAKCIDGLEHEPREVFFPGKSINGVAIDLLELRIIEVIRDI